MGDLFCRLQGKDPLNGIYPAVNTFPGYNDSAKLLLSAPLMSYKENNMYLLTVWRLPGRDPGSSEVGYAQSKKNSVVTSKRMLPCLVNFELLLLSF